MTIAIMAVVSLSNIICLFIGAKIGQLSASGKDINVPSPISAVREYREEKELVKEREKNQTMLENIENYDGTGIGQKDI